MGEGVSQGVELVEPLKFGGWLQASVDSQVFVTDSPMHSKKKKSNWRLLAVCECLYCDQVADLHGYQIWRHFNFYFIAVAWLHFNTIVHVA